MTEPHNNPSPLMHSSSLEATPQPPKKKRSLPGMPDPDAEVIALSPKTLLATNRFVCEICNKGFQRDQNLQLHRRGHNLPWKLRQRESSEPPRKKVYVCPEASCVHHNPARALGDLTGIKKHFCRKHGEKKWKCERCSKNYAVQSDWKAHMKTCGTREYRCDCGTMFTRRDSFITHRAFCDVLAQESARAQDQAQAQPQAQGVSNSNAVVASSPPTPPLTPSASVVSPTLSVQSSENPENPTKLSPTSSNATCFVNSMTNSSTNPSSSTTCTTVFASVLAPSTTATASQSQSQSKSTSSFSNLMREPNNATANIMREPTSLSLSTSLYLPNNDPPHYTSSPQPAALSATALLQKAAQMGSRASNTSLLRGLGLATPPSFAKDDSVNINATTTTMQWNGQVKQENHSVMDNLGLGLPSGSGAVPDVMMGPSTPFVGQPMTRDLLGLGIGGGDSSRGGLSALLTSFGGNFDSSSSEGGLHR